ncbi:MAG: ABC transporter permease subunit [Pirellulales bacterium]|nr:ABC transporter permease subunit [Pirellulales bacterium]
MLRNVFLKTLRDARGAVLAWGIGLAILAAAIVYVFSTIRDDASLKSLDAVVQRLSPIIRAFIGSEDIPSVTTFDGFMRIEFLNSLPLLLSIFAIVEGTAAVALEEERRSIDLLMAQPIRRWRVVVEKYAALVVAAYAIAALAGLGMVAATRFVVVEPPWYRMMLATTQAVPPALVVGGLALLGSCALRRRRSAIIVAAVFLAASFFLNVLAQIAELIRPWRKLSIFYGYGASRPLSGELIPGYTWWLLLAAVVLVVLAVFAFGRKELAV